MLFSNFPKKVIQGTSKLFPLIHTTVIKQSPKFRCHSNLWGFLCQIEIIVTENSYDTLPLLPTNIMRDGKWFLRSYYSDYVEADRLIKTVDV